MIKYINDGEIEVLKRGFHYTLALKKINMFDSNKFMNKELDLKKAIKMYKSIAALNFPGYYSNCSAIMLEYLVKENLLEEDELNKITEIFRGDGETDESIEYGDYSEERSSFILEFLKNLSSEKGIEVHSETFRNIVLGEYEYLDLNIYGELRDTLRNHMGNSQDDLEDDLEEDYYNIFQDDATVYVLEGFEMNDNQLNLLNNTFTCSDSGILSEAYTNKGNTYITISDMQVYDGLEDRFLIILKLIFMSNN